jgi:hypothetical protein
MKLEEIATDVDYRELGFLESTIMHEAKRKGYRAVLDKSKQYLEQYPENDYEYNLLCGLFNYFAVRVYGFEMYEPRRTKKVINQCCVRQLFMSSDCLRPAYLGGCRW